MEAALFLLCPAKFNQIHAQLQIALEGDGVRIEQSRRGVT